MSVHTLLLFGALLLAVVKPSLARVFQSGTSQKPSAVSLVPAANWQPRTSQKLDVSEVSRWGGDAAVDREYGVKSIQLSTYQLLDKTADVIVEEGPDASAAYGLFTYYRNETMAPEKGIPFAITGPGMALMARSRTFLRVFLHTDPPVSRNELRGLLILIGGTGPSAEVTATLPTALPSAGLVRGSEKYFLGPEASQHLLPSLNTDLVGFSQGAEAQLARYDVNSLGMKIKQDRGGALATVLAITYPTPQLAQQRFGLMEKALSLNQGDGEQPVYGKRKGSFVILAFNVRPEAANKLLGQFDVSGHISWDQRYPGSKPIVLQMVQLVIANFFLAFILTGLAVVGGILIALSKRAAGKWFPEWEWGNPDGETLTTLKLR